MTGRFRGTIASVALGGVLALSGCGTNDTAAIVDGTRVSASDAAIAAQQFNVQFPPDPGNPSATTADVVGFAILIPTILRIAAAHGIAQTSEGAAGQLTKIADPNPLLVQIQRTNDVAARLDNPSKQEIAAAFAKLNVTVNPRFGTFDPKTAGVKAGAAPWIVPGASPTTAP